MTTLEPRKTPRQRRSRQTRDDILDAAVRVLRRDGALRFTTTRVAEAAGLSVGSLYQYFPNKHAIAAAIHRRAVDSAWTGVQRILDDGGQPPRARLRGIASLYFHAEARDVALLGGAPPDLAALLEGHPSDDPLLATVGARFDRFVAEATGSDPLAVERGGAELLMAVVEAVGREVAKRPLSDVARERWATACADSVCEALGFAD